MLRYKITALALGLTLFIAGCDDSTPEEEALVDAPYAQVKNGELIPDQYIVVLKDGTTVQAYMGTQLGKAAKDLVHTYAGSRGFQGFAAKMTAEQASAYAQDPKVAYVEQDRWFVLSDAANAAGNPSSVTAVAAQSTPWGITRVGGAANGAGLRACVLDTGVNVSHPDLVVDTQNSKTFISFGKDSKNVEDGNGHGTHVAGTIAAKNDANGVVGVAAGATIVAIKVLNSQGSGSTSDIVAALNYVASKGTALCAAANMSLGGGVSTALDNAVTAAAATGVKFALAAGNESANANTSSPGRVNATNVITIAATDSADKLATFSNYSASIVDWAEPGVSILSTWKNGAYNTISGTSMATPHATGLLLLGGPRSDGRQSSADPQGAKYYIGVQ